MAFLAVLALLACVPAAAASAQVELELLGAYEAPRVTAVSQAQIVRFASNPDFYPSDATVAFAEEPSARQPYALGLLSDESLARALAAVNTARYIAGLGSDVALDDACTRQAQAAALVLAANDARDLTHEPARPAGMDDDLYALGFDGCATSNVARNFASVGNSVLFGYLSDADAANRANVGHRRWVLNPALGKTGFGYARTADGRTSYTAMKATDESDARAWQYNVAWPAQNMPVELFDGTMPWSLATGQAQDAGKVKVALTRLSDGAQWAFSQQASDGLFAVENSDYAAPGCVIFRPNGLNVHAGDRFAVRVDGITHPCAYVVEFFSFYDAQLDSALPVDAQRAWFPDVGERHWAFWPVAKTADAGLFYGYGDGTFRPGRSINRAEAVVVLWRYLVSQGADGTAPAGKAAFSDVPADAWYATAVNWAAQHGIVHGSGGRFRPGETVSRAELCVMLANAAEACGVHTGGADGALAAVADAERVPAWARPGVAWCLDRGVVNGKPSGGARVMDAHGKVTRAEMAAMLANAMEGEVFYG